MSDFIRYTIFSRLHNREHIYCKHCEQSVDKTKYLFHLIRECDFRLIECRKCWKIIFSKFYIRHKDDCKIINVNIKNSRIL